MSFSVHLCTSWVISDSLPMGQGVGGVLTVRLDTCCQMAFGPAVALDPAVPTQPGDPRKGPAPTFTQFLANFFGVLLGCEFTFPLRPGYVNTASCSYRPQY